MFLYFLIQNQVRFCSSDCLQQYYDADSVSVCGACDRIIWDDSHSKFFDYGKKWFCGKCCAKLLQTKGQAKEDFEDYEVKIHPLIQTITNYADMYEDHTMEYDDFIEFGCVIC